MKVDSFQGELQAMMFEAANTKPVATGQKVGADFKDMLNSAINNVNGSCRLALDAVTLSQPL